MRSPLENHLAQFLLGVSKRAVTQHKDSFFVPTIPSLSFGLDEIINEKKLNEKLKINEIPSANPIFWPHPTKGDIENKIKEFFDIYELNEDQMISSDYDKEKEVSQKIQNFDQQIQELAQKIKEQGQNSQELDQIDQNANIIQSMNDQLEDLQAKKKDFINSNISFSIEHYKTIFQKHQQNDQMNKSSISFVDQNKIQISQSENLTFTQFSYSSQDQEPIVFQEETYENKIAQSLKGFGLGKQESLDKLEKSIEEAFENLNLECEYSQINFERNWMPLDLFSNQNIGLLNKEISKWSNGTKHDQDQSAEFPYIVVGAVFCQNLVINGLKTDESTKNILQEMKNKQSESYCLIFNCQEDMSENNTVIVSEDSINIQSLRILGLILCPLQSFPKLVCQEKQFPLELATIKISDYIRTFKEDEILNLLKNEQEISRFNDWQEKSSQIIDKLKDKDKIQDKQFPMFQNNVQKQQFINKYKENKIEQDLTRAEKTINALYKGLNSQIIREFKKLADDYEILTNNMEAVFQEEISELEKIFKETEQIQEKIDFKDLSKKFFIHKDIIQKIYENMKQNSQRESLLQIDPKIENLREEIYDLINGELPDEDILNDYSNNPNINSIQNWEQQIQLIIQQLKSPSEEQTNNEQIFQIFARFSNMNEQELKTKLQQKSSELVSIMYDIFEANPDEYSKIKIMCQQQNQLNFLLDNEDNEIESFFKNIKNPKKLSKLDVITDKNPILCLKILSELVRQNSQIIPQQQEDQDIFRMNEQFTEIIETNSPNDLLGVFVKALLLQQQTENHDKAEAQQNYEKFEQNLTRNYTEQEISNFKQQFDQIDTNYHNLEDKQSQIDDLLKNQFNQIEENDFKIIKYYFMKEEKCKFYREKYELNQTKDLESLSQISQTSIALHYKSNLSEYKIYGEQMLDQNNLRQIVHLVIDNQNSTFSILNILPSNESHNQINLDDFKATYKQIYEILQPWLQKFLGYKSLFTFIYDLKQKCCNKQNVEILKKLVQQYELFKDNQNDNFQTLKNVCTRIQNQPIFIEWFESIQQTNIGSKFAQKFEILWARSNVQRQILIQNIIKAKFQGFEKILDLKDFNRLRGRKDIDSLKQDLLNARDDGNNFMNEVIQQMFGYIIRREDIQKLVDHLKEIQSFSKISVRFLISLVLQYSNIELRQRLIYYLSEYYSVPLIVICQNQYLNGKQNLVYLPEIAFEMLEGIGVFNFGAGKRCLQFCGKSQLMNDLLFPSGQFYHQAFEQNDENIFTNGQVDVFFEKSFSYKRQIVIMDGQGSLCNKAIQSVSKLTNIAIINFSFEEIEEFDSLRDLQKKIEFIKQNNSDSFVLLVLRDTTSSQQQNQKLSNIVKNKQNIQQVNLLEEIDKKVDFCILLENMSQIDKSKRLEIISPILQFTNQKIKEIQQTPQKFKFTKNNFIENFLQDEEQNKYRVEKIKQVIKKSEDFIDQVHKIKDDIYQENALPILQLKSQIRQQILEIRNNVTLDGEIQELQEKNMDQNLEELKEKTKQKIPSQILLDFKNIVQNQDGNRSLILYEIQKELRKITYQQLKDPIDRKNKLNIKQKEEAKQIKSFSKEEKLARQEQYEKELQEINDDILKRQISLEHFWRCLVFYMESETNFPEFNDKIQKDLISQSIDDILKNGDCFELIDGENLEFKGQFVQEVINQNRKDKVLVVCVIGPQSSGKSTLMNFSFGTQFFTSSGRCTKGIYFTLQKFPSDIPNSSNVKWLLMLDTEGLQSPERQDKEYDRKIVLFAMLSANVVIINSRGEINSQMTDTLKMCCLTFDKLKQQGITPQIIYTNGQNNDSDISKICQQVQDLKPKVIEASNSPTIEKTAEEILGYNDDKIIIFGYAYNSQVFQQEKMRGLDQNISFQLGNTNFGVETSNIFKKICEMIQHNKIEYFEFSKWLDDSRRNWILIDKFSGDINAFSNLDEFKNDQKVNKKMHELWENYLSEIKIDNDTTKITEKKIQLLQIFKQNGKYIYDKKIEEIDKENQKEKEEHLQKYIFDKFENWMQSQRGITAESIKKYYKIIRAKMDQEKIDFMFLLQEKLKEEQMDYINETSFIFLQEKAEQIRKNLEEKSEQEKEIYIQNEFDKCWNQYLQEIQKEYKLDESKKSQFNNLLQSFRLENQFIQQVGEKQYKALIKRIDQNIKPDDDFGKLNFNLLQFLINELTTESVDMSEMFKLDNAFQFMCNDPIKRLFDDNFPEKYLKLKELIQFNYHYKVINDMNKFDKKILKAQIIKNLNIKVYKLPQGVQMLNFQVDDINEQSKQMTSLIKKFSQYGFYLGRNKSMEDYWDYDYNMSNQDLKQICKKLFDENEKKKFAKLFAENLKFDKNKQKQNIEQQMIKYFEQEDIFIYNRIKHDESINQHIDYLKQIQDSKFQIVEQKSNKNDQQTENIDYNLNSLQKKFNVYLEKLIPIQTKQSEKLNKQYFESLINPIDQERPLIQKQKQLSYIAQKSLDWEIISQEIIQNVQQVLNFEVQNQQISNSQQDINIQNRLEQVYMTPQQIKDLQNNYINQLSDQIEKELKQKLGLNLTLQMRAKISWCALLTSWIIIYKKAQQKFNQYFRWLDKKKEQQYKIFKDDVLGNSSKNLNIQLIIRDCLKKIEDTEKPIQQSKILQEIKQIQNSFETLSVYQQMDNLYLKSNQKDQNDQIKYAENQLIFFEQYARDLQQELIEKKIIEKFSLEAYKKLDENLKNALNLFELLNKQKQKGLYNWYSVLTYFQIKFHQSDYILNMDEKQQLVDSLSPVIYQVLINILTGNATDMNKILFDQTDENSNNKSKEFITLKDNKGKENNYEFIILEDGPLQIFTKQEFNDQIKSNQNCQLITEILSELKQKQYQNDAKKLYEIDKIIGSAINYLKQELINLQNKNFDSKYFECKEKVDFLYIQAIGCKVQCTFCKRKCELQFHSSDLKHNCDTVGHQQRVFSGGFIKFQDGTLFPSLRSCDNRQTNNKIKIQSDNLDKILQQYGSLWSVEQQGGENGQDNFRQQQKILTEFWERIGQKYCEENQLEYLKNQDDYDRILEGKIYQSSIEVIILDESRSMWFWNRWTNAVNGAKQYIEYIRNNHIYPEKVQLSIIFFGSEARVVHKGTLNVNIDENIWVRNGSGTDFGKPLEEAIRQIDSFIENKQTATINFFTDGHAKFPDKSIELVKDTIKKSKENYLKNNRQKLKIFLMCENDKNPNLKEIQKKLNEFNLRLSLTEDLQDSKKDLSVQDSKKKKDLSGQEMCKLVTNIDTKDLGNTMIESFSNLKIIE